MPRRDCTVTSTWPAGSAAATTAATPRDDLLREADTGDGTFVQAHGPFHRYRRTVTTAADGTVAETITYRLDIPVFGALFALPVRRAVRHRRAPGSPSPWWAPPDQLNERQVRALALLALAAASAAFANTLYTQTANAAATAFGISDRGLGQGGAIVRVGVLISLPFAFLADRTGRRRMIVLLAWLAPIGCAIGALSPSFWFLTASQTVARPLGIALGLLAGVAAAEEMPRNSRAYALSVLALAAGLGAGVAVSALPLRDTGPNGWRLAYALALLLLPIGLHLGRSLDETRRFQTVHRIQPPMDRRRLALIVGVAVTANLFVAPASFFQNAYLEDIRGYSGSATTLFTLATGTPASLGLVLGGRLADMMGRRRLIMVCTPLSTLFLVLAFMVSGPWMWGCALAGSITASLAYPAYAVYRAELFPTGNRGGANGLITAAALLSGSLGILAVGVWRDHGASFGTLMAVMAIGQLVAAGIAVAGYPETAHLALEEINPGDPAIAEE
ncbi:MAG: MFS transporter [Ilumatobacter sp.]|nr:MFS transporter [Ilumatobacter sp.]